MLCAEEMDMSFRVLPVVVLGFFVASACLAAGESPFGINGTGWSHLGANSGSLDSTTAARRLDSLAAMGAKWDRCDFWWHRIQPEPDRFVWTDYDRAIDAYDKAGVKVLPILCYDAAWHPSLSPTSAEYREEYGRFVYETVKHFKGRISAYEIWNEPNGAQYWRPAPDAGLYTELLKVAYREAKRADPSVTVVGGAVAGMDWPFIEGMLKAGAAKYMDVISVHPYQGNLGSTGPEAGNLAADLRRLKALLKQYNAANTRIWITEMGNRTIPDPYIAAGKPQPSGRVTEQQQANYLVRSYAIALSEGVERVFWFNLQDWPNETWGTITEKDWRRKPSWYAYRAMASMLTGKKLINAREANGDTHFVGLFSDEASTRKGLGAIAWNEGPPSVVNLTGTPVIDISLPANGLSAPPVISEHRTNPSGVVVNEEPVYFTGNSGIRFGSPVQIAATPGSVAAGDPLRISISAKKGTATRSGQIKAFQNQGVPVLYSRDSHTPVPNGLRRGVQGGLVVGNVPPGDYLAGYRLPNGSVAAGSVRVVPAVSVSVQPNPVQGSDLSVVFTNHSSRRISASATVDMVGNRTDGLTHIELAPHEVMTMSVSNAQMPSAQLTEPLPVSVTLTAPSGAASWSGNVYFWSAGAKKPGPPLVLDSAQDWQSQDGSWTGPEDLSVTMTARYDKQRLYLHADVLDDVFSQPYVLGEVWRGDAFQIAIDPQWSGKPDASDATEFALALTADGPQVYRWTGKAGLMPGADLKVRRDGLRTTYDASIPWNEVGISAIKPPQTIGFAFILNDSDGKDRQGWLMYGDGIATEKRADRYATITLLP